MAGYRPTQIRKPANETEFEKNCVILFKEILNDPNVQRLGTRGQCQYGVDLVGNRGQDPKLIVGIQCKLKSGTSKLTKDEVRKEVGKAIGYRPQLSEYFIVTTSKDDTQLAQLAQQLMQDQEDAGRRLNIKVWGWDTLQENIDQYESAKQVFDPGFSPSINSQGRKLDALLAGQRHMATQDQVAVLADRMERGDREISTRLPQRFADRELTEGLSRALRRSGFVGTDVAAELAALANRVIDGDLVLASSTIRAEVCDRAARANAAAETATAARRFYDSAATLDPSRDLFIANALLKEAEGDPDATLRILRMRSDLEARSALFMTLIHQRGADAALNWARSERHALSDFNSLGAVNFVLKQIANGEFKQALTDIGQAPDEYFDQCPALRLLRAQLTLSSILPVDQIAALFQGLPLNPSILQLAAGQRSQERIRAADEDLRALLGTLDELDLGHLESFLSEFNLWLRLEDVTTRENARAQLAAEIADPEKTLRRVRLALAYGVPFNQEALQRHLAGRKEIGGWTSDERFAAFLIAYHSDDPKKIVEFFDRNHDDLFAQTDLVRDALAGIEIEALARIGRFEEARQHIAFHRGTDLTPEQADNIQQIVAHIEMGDEVESLRQRYAESQSLADLRLLVSRLRARHDTRQLATFAPMLARATKTLDDFDLAIKSLLKASWRAEVLALTEELPEIFELDDEYAAIKGWSLYGLGRVMEARAIARRLLERRNVASDRELAINTAVESGDWGHLQAILAREVSRADNLPVNELIRLARLALEAGSPYVDQFRDAALHIAPDDPQVNLAAYMLATERGEESRSPQAHEWFRKAIEQSGPDGPIRSVSMHKLVDQVPGWNQHTENIDQLLRRAEAPLFIAAKGLRRQLIDLTLGQALRNTDPDDPRIRYPVFAFSGARPILDLSEAKSVAFDITALITLDYLGLLEMALGYFQRLIVAPNTLSLLFMERQFLKVHQPSEMAKAERIQALIAAGRLKVTLPESSSVSDVSKEIGRDLAALLSAAQNGSGLVVRTAPVSKLGSFLEETADMNGYAPVLTDTLTVLSFLASRGKIDAATQKSAQAYLRQVDTGWQAANPIDASTTLYLDDLAVTYLDHTGILDVLTQSVGAAFVHGDLDKRTREVLRYGKHAEALLSAIEQIRNAIATRVEAGLIDFSARRGQDENAEGEADAMLGSAPTLDLMSDLSGINAVIADDRCLNKLSTWTDGSEHNAVVGSVLDVLATLKTAGRIDEETYWRARYQLRAAGYYAVPLESLELLHHLSAAPITDEKLRETPELRAVRESLALPQVNSCFTQAEGVWLNGTRLAVCMAIRDLWLQIPNLSHAEAQSNWLLSVLPNPLEWCFSPDNETAWAAARQQAAVQVGLMMVFVGASGNRRKRYFAWLEEKLVTPLKTAHPEIWDAALDFLRSYIPNLFEIEDEKTRTDLQEALFALVIDPLPESARTSLFSDQIFCTKLGIVPKWWLHLGRENTVDTDDLCTVLRTAVANKKSAILALRGGGRERVQLGLQRGGKATLTLKKERISFSDADILASDHSIRVRAIKRVFTAKPLLVEEEQKWRTVADKGVFTNREYVELMMALGATPEALRNELQEPRSLDVEKLIPDEPRYYQRLIAPLGDSTTLDAYIHGELVSARKMLLARHPEHALRRMAFAALWQPLIPFELLDSINFADVASLLKSEDPFSLLFGFELCRDRLSANSGFDGLGCAFLERLLLDSKGSTSRCNIFSAVALISTTRLRQVARASNAPLFWVRLAALTHAGVLTDALSGLPDSEQFLKWSTQKFYPAYLWHGVIDRRDSPRWRADWISPDHLYAELVGRAQGTLHTIPEAERPAEWVSAINTALDRLQRSGKVLAAYFPGPFDDFREITMESTRNEVFSETEANLDRASMLSDVPELFGLAYATQPSARVVESVLRILSLPADQPIASGEHELPFLRLCAHIASSARSETLANAVINRCLFEAGRLGSEVAVPDLFSIMAEACAAHSDDQQHRELLGTTAAKLCFAVEKNEDLSNLESIFDVLATRDEKLIAALAKAQAIARTKRARI